MSDKKITDWLDGKQYAYFYNFPLGGKVPDLIAVKNDELVAFCKCHAGDRDMPLAIGKCMFYLKDANKAYVIISSEDEKLLSKSDIDVLKDNGIGVIVTGNDVEILIEARRHQRNNVSVINRIISKDSKKGRYDINESIVELLREHPEGLDSVKISKMLDISRTTVSKYIYGLLSKNTVVQRSIGTSKLCYLRMTKND